MEACPLSAGSSLQRLSQAGVGKGYKREGPFELYGNTQSGLAGWQLTREALPGLAQSSAQGNMTFLW